MAIHSKKHFHHLLWAIIILSPVFAIYFIFFMVEDETADWLTQTVRSGNIENSITATGTLEPKTYVDVGAQVSGQVEHIWVSEGDIVEAGELLVEIDASVFETQVQNATASLENKKAQLRQLDAELTLAQLREKRNKGLYERRAVSKDALVKSETDVKVLDARITAMHAQIEADKAKLAGDKVMLDFAKIYAPMSGTVVSVDVRQGQTLNANQNAPLLLRIADLKTLTLRASVSEADVTKLFHQMPLYFETFGGEGRRWHSTLRQILPTPEVINDVVLYQTLIDIDNADGHLMDAMTAQVFFLLDSAENTLKIPKGAVHEDAGGAWVNKVEDEHLVKTYVQLGVSNRTHTQIISGLSRKDVILVGTKNSANKPQARGLGQQTDNGPRRRPGGG